MTILRELLKERRRILGESGTEFGKRFGVTHATVSGWENGVYDMPNRVVEWLLADIDPTDLLQPKECPTCNSSGVLFAKPTPNTNPTKEK